FLAVLRGIHREALALEARGKGFPQRGLVFDQKDSHALSLSCSGDRLAPRSHRPALLVIGASRATRAVPGTGVVHIADPATIVHVLHPRDAAPFVRHQFRTEDLATGGALHPAHRFGQRALLLARVGGVGADLAARALAARRWRGFAVGAHGHGPVGTATHARPTLRRLGS